MRKIKPFVLALIGLVFYIAGAYITLAPVQWVFTEDPSYFLMLLISWIPGLILLKIGELIMGR